MMSPQVDSMNRVAGGALGDKHSIMLFDNIKSAGIVQYAFIVAVFDNSTKQPIYFVTSEINGAQKEFGGGSHFLCTFEGDMHANMGCDDKWGDGKTFFLKAIKMAEEKFLPSPKPAEEPL